MISLCPHGPTQLYQQVSIQSYSQTLMNVLLVRITSCPIASGNPALLSINNKDLRTKLFLSPKDAICVAALLIVQYRLTTKDF